jgi:hypothetical protein
MNLKLLTICAGLFTVSVCQAQTSIEDQMNRLKTDVLNGNLSTLTVACPAGYQSMPAHVQLACAVTLRILIDDLQQNGEFGRTICPAYSGKSFEPLFEAITDYVSEKDLPSTERAETIARIAMAQRFPCTGDRSTRQEWHPSWSPVER